MLICSEVLRIDIILFIFIKLVEENVQRLENEDILPINFPRAPSNFLFYINKS